MLNNTDKKISFIMILSNNTTLIYYNDGTREAYDENNYYDLNNIPVVNLSITPEECLDAYLSNHTITPHFSSGADNNIDEFIDELIKFRIMVIKNGK